MIYGSELGTQLSRVYFPGTPTQEEARQLREAAATDREAAEAAQRAAEADRAAAGALHQAVEASLQAGSAASHPKAAQHQQDHWVPRRLLPFFRPSPRLRFIFPRLKSVHGFFLLGSSSRFCIRRGGQRGGCFLGRINNNSWLGHLSWPRVWAVRLEGFILKI